MTVVEPIYRGPDPEKYELHSQVTLPWLYSRYNISFYPQYALFSGNTYTAI